MTMRRIRSALLILILFSFSLAHPAFSQTAVEKARLARTMWSAFECMRFAGMSKNEEDAERLFGVGLKAGREFFEAVEAQQIPPDVLRREVPIGVNLHAQGPTADFRIGRIYEAASEDAYDSIVKEDNGVPLDPSKWIFDDDLQKLKAENAYLRSNCVLLK